jgi:hypothetical protein
MKQLVVLWICTLVSAGALAGEHALTGDWALELPSGEAGWLSIRTGSEGWVADLLWAVGSARPVKDFKVTGDRFTFTRSVRAPGALKSTPPAQHRILGTARGDVLTLEMETAGGGGESFRGRRLPPLPPRPDLGRVRFGDGIVLFNGRDLSGWRVTDAAKKNGWSARDGVLRNDTPKTDFSAYGDHANLRTEAEFEDFHLVLEYRLPADGGNSGVYLRGLYEAQVTHRDSSMQGINGPGAIFGRIAPVRNAGRPGGEWNRYELTLVDRHITVVLNGDKVIDNQPVAGPTGGALHADVTRPGPVYLQGDHTSVEYRNLVLRPVSGRAK